MEKIWLKNYPTGIPHELPPLDKNLIQLFEETCEEFKNQTAFISFGQKISYQELKEKALHLAGYWQSQGLKKGDTVVLQLPNILQYPISLWAAFLSGFTVVNMNPLYTAREMSGPITETNAKGIVLLSSNIPSLKTFFHQTGLQSVIVTDPGDLLSFPKKTIINFIFKIKTKNYYPVKLTGTTSFLKALHKGSKHSVQIQKRALQETFLIQYTGGTTGIPKGACLSQKNILSNIRQTQLWISDVLKRGKEQALAPLPLYHIFAFMVNGLVFFFNGFSNLLIANPRDITSLIKALEKHPVSIGTGVNTLFRALLTHPRFKKINFRSWRVFVAGGMPLETAVQKQWSSITNSLLIEGYGLTEASPIICCNRLDKNHTGYVGFPFPSTEIRVTDENEQELGINIEGELEVRGPQVMLKYYKQHEETEKIFKNEAWLKTGDIAKITREGLVQIIDRKKDMINISGLKVYPREVEDVILSFHKVKDTAVIASKNDAGAEIIKAFVVKATDELNEKELKSYCKHHLAPYKIPKQVEFIPQIPKNALGKPLRKLLKTS